MAVPSLLVRRPAVIVGGSLRRAFDGDIWGRTLLFGGRRRVGAVHSGLLQVSGAPIKNENDGKEAYISNSSYH